MRLANDRLGPSHRIGQKLGFYKVLIEDGTDRIWLLTRCGIRHDGEVWGRRCVDCRCATQLTVVEYLLGSRSGIPISLCRHVQFLVWWTKAGPARDGALGSAFQILLLGFGLFISCGYQGDAAPSHFCTVSTSLLGR